MRARRRWWGVVLESAALRSRIALAWLFVALPSLALAQAASTSASPAPAAGESSTATEPELKPGIPGLKMTDVRDHKHLWREINELQSWERSNRISVAEYRGKTIEKTAQFLGFAGADAENFNGTARRAVAAVREAFERTRRSDADPSNPDPQYDAAIHAAVEQLTDLLKSEPRHELFRPDCTKWLLRLAFGPKESKEAQEAKTPPPAETGPKPSPIGR